MCGTKLYEPLVACMIASQPPGIPTPNCPEVNWEDSRPVACLVAILAVNLRRILTTAINLIPPCYLVKAHKEAP